MDMHSKREMRKNKKMNEDTKSLPSTSINWYPGHMAKTKREIKEKIDLIDIVFEVVDARIPYSSKNKDIEEMTNSKPRVIIMTKIDLCDMDKTNGWIKYYEDMGYKVLLVSLNNNDDYKRDTQNKNSFIYSYLNNTPINVPSREEDIEVLDFDTELDKPVVETDLSHATEGLEKINTDNNTDKTNNTSSKTGEQNESSNVPSNNVNAETNPYKNGFINSDNMKNTRFQLTENGLKAIYNKAPVLNGLDELRVVKGTEPNFNDGVTTTDELDDKNNIKNNIVIDQTGFDKNTVGVYGVTYTVTDSWGRTTSKVRNVKVVSKVENNLISLDDNSNNKLFEIGFDTVKNKLTFKKIIQGSENVGNGENQGTEEGGSDGEDTGSGDV